MSSRGAGTGISFAFKIFYMKWNILFLLLFTSFSGNTQQAISMELAAVQNTSYHLSGVSVSCFYHFSKRINGGLELNRFFPKGTVKSNEDVQLSAWDLNLNFHYIINPEQKWRFYPIAGITHTSDKEELMKNGECNYEHFWSLNTGAGLLYSKGKWAPHIEYHMSWGRHNQQIILAGFSYELAWGKEHK